MMAMGILSVRLDEELEKRLQFLLEKRKISDKSTYIRQLLSKSIANELLDYLCDEVKLKHMSVWKAAEYAQISLRSMLQELANREIVLYTEEAFQDDLVFSSKKK